jgi:hypothetical protein
MPTRLRVTPSDIVHLLGHYDQLLEKEVCKVRQCIVTQLLEDTLLPIAKYLRDELTKGIAVRCYFEVYDSRFPLWFVSLATPESRLVVERFCKKGVDTAAIVVPVIVTPNTKTRVVLHGTSFRICNGGPATSLRGAAGLVFLPLGTVDVAFSSLLRLLPIPATGKVLLTSLVCGCPPPPSFSCADGSRCRARWQCAPQACTLDACRTTARTRGPT